MFRFIPQTSEDAHIHFVPGDGCSSSVGMTGQVQSVSLGRGCVRFGIVIHELMHVLGEFIKPSLSGLLD